MTDHPRVLPSIEIVSPSSPAIPVIAGRLSAEWGKQQGYAYADTLAWCDALADSSDEALLCARVAGDIVGIAALVTCDLASHPHLMPWLSSLLIEPEHRGKGYGRLIVEHLCSLAAERGARGIHLYAAAGPLASYYGRLGWMRTERLQIDGAEFLLMRRSLP